MEEEIGSGACGVVYAARNPEDKKILCKLPLAQTYPLVAIKKSSLDPEQSSLHYYAIINVFKLMKNEYFATTTLTPGMLFDTMDAIS